MLRWGLCCLFVQAPIRFRRTTASYLKRMPRAQQLERLAVLCQHNAGALYEALTFCHHHGIGAFRINSQILPLKTHPELGYDINELPGYRRIVERFKACGRFSRRHDLRTTFHPDQFVLLSSPTAGVTERSILELKYQAQVARWVNADVITLHAGGGYGDKASALTRLSRQIAWLPADIRRRLALENDDKIYTPQDLLPVCRRTGIPLVYDVHHHRCLPDGRGVEETTQLALATWQREPLVHLSSPRDVHKPRQHHDFIDLADLPTCWLTKAMTVEVEAKAKEKAVLKLKAEVMAFHKSRLGARVDAGAHLKPARGA